MVADPNEDGRPDLVTANAGAIAVLVGNGDGTFQPMALFDAGPGARSPAIADFDGDGHVDIAVADAFAADTSAQDDGPHRQRSGSTR